MWTARVAFSSGSLNQRVALSYTGDGWNLTANAILGAQLNQVTGHPQVSPCPVSLAYPHSGCNPDFLNVDLTATKSLASGSWVRLVSIQPISAHQRPVTRSKANSRLAV